MLIAVHLSLMIAGALCLAAGIGTAMFNRKNKSWLNRHKTFNTLGACFLAAGAAVAFIHVISSEGGHLSGLHPVIGLTALILACCTLFLGYDVLKIAKKAFLRAVHRWTGRFSAITVAGALILGFKMIGIF